MHISEKENITRMQRGEMPAYLPNRGYVNVRCSVFVDVKSPGYHVDEFGVEYIGKDDIFGGSPIPYPGRYVLHDICRWRDFIKVPDLSGVDWEAAAKADLQNVDREECGIVFYFGKIFQRLCDFMGFEEGLCAIAEEPEEVYALFEYLCDFYIDVLKKYIPSYRPEAICIPDDTATARGPFISRKTYQNLVLPFHRRIAELALENGVFIQKHDCGRCEDFIEDWIDMGVTAWDPAQPSNDLKGIKEKYGRRLIIAGGWDSQGPASFPETDERIFKDLLAEYVDTLAPNGGFIFAAYVAGQTGDPEVKRRNEMIRDFYQDYARDWYARH